MTFAIRLYSLSDYLEDNQNINVKNQTALMLIMSCCKADWTMQQKISNLSLENLEVCSHEFCQLLYRISHWSMIFSYNYWWFYLLHLNLISQKQEHAFCLCNCKKVKSLCQKSISMSDYADTNR